MTTDPRIVSLDAIAEEAALDWSPYKGPSVGIVRSGPYPFVQVSITLHGMPARPPEGYDYTANTYLNIDMLDELLRDLLAVRASLLKLQGDK